MAARDLTSGMSAAVQAGTVYPAILYEGEFDDGAGGSAFLRVWTGLGSLSWDGKTWTGAGNFIGISGVDESVELRAQSFEVWLNGSSSAIVAAAMVSGRKNRSGKLWLACFADANYVGTPEVYLLKQGLFDRPSISDAGVASKVSVIYEDYLAMLGLARERRYTSASQALRDPNDKGFDNVEELQDAQFSIPG
jgi:hypothetical protein